MMVVKKPFSLKQFHIFDIILGLLAIISIYGFWVVETNNFFKIIISILLVISIIMVLAKHNGSILFVVGFIASSVLYRAIELGYISNAIASLIIFFIAVFLFYYRNITSFPKFSVKKIFSVYNSLIGLLIAELFVVLSYFPIEAKNKAILIILFIWLYDEIIERNSTNELSRKYAITVSVIFSIILIIISLTFPFKLL